MRGVSYSFSNNRNIDKKYMRNFLLEAILLKSSVLRTSDDIKTARTLTVCIVQTYFRTQLVVSGRYVGIIM